jgi:hypothetical protein
MSCDFRGLLTVYYYQNRSSGHAAAPRPEIPPSHGSPLLRWDSGQPIAVLLGWEPGLTSHVGNLVRCWPTGLAALAGRRVRLLGCCCRTADERGKALRSSGISAHSDGSLIKCYISFASRRKGGAPIFAAVHESLDGPERLCRANGDSAACWGSCGHADMPAAGFVWRC